MKEKQKILLFLLLIIGGAALLKNVNFWTLVQPDYASCGIETCTAVNNHWDEKYGYPVLCDVKPCPSLKLGNCLSKGSIWQKSTGIQCPVKNSIEYGSNSCCYPTDSLGHSNCDTYVYDKIGGWCYYYEKDCSKVSIDDKYVSVVYAKSLVNNAWVLTDVEKAKTDVQYNDLCVLGCENVDLTHWDKTPSTNTIITQVPNSKFSTGSVEYECAAGPCIAKSCLPWESFNNAKCSCQTNTNQILALTTMGLLGIAVVVFIAKKKN